MTDQAEVSSIPPLKGFLVGESDSEIRVWSGAGTWTLKRDDVLGVADWEVADSAVDGRPVLVDVRVGAVADYTQSVRVEVTERPMTIQDSYVGGVGMELLEAMTSSWASNIAITLEPFPGGGYTASACQSDSNGISDDYYPCDSLD